MNCVKGASNSACPSFASPLEIGFIHFEKCAELNSKADMLSTERVSLLA